MGDYTLSDYHERSKHRLNRYALGPGQLDWANQPNPFRRYEGAARIELPLVADDLETRFSALRGGRQAAPREISLDSIAILFELSLGISACNFTASFKSASSESPRACTLRRRISANCAAMTALR